MIGKLRSVVVDTRDPLALATFWAGVLGGRVMTDEDENDDTWVVVTDPTGRRLAFQLAPQHEPPTFPDPRGSQQFHLDILVDPTPETTLLDIGAIRHELHRLLGVPVDVLTPNALPERFRARVLAEARSI